MSSKLIIKAAAKVVLAVSHEIKSMGVTDQVAVSHATAAVIEVLSSTDELGQIMYNYLKEVEGLEPVNDVPTLSAGLSEDALAGAQNEVAASEQKAKKDKPK